MYRLLILISVSATVCVPTVIPQSKLNSDTIHVLEVRPLKTSGGTELRQVTVNLNFPGKTSLYVDGYGEVPSVVTLTYITDAQILTVRTGVGRPTIAEQSLSPTAISMGGDLDLVPRESFKLFGGNGPAPTTQRFRAAQADVLTGHFLLPPYVYTHNTTTFSETRYHRLTVDDRNLIIEVAVQLAFPSESATKAGFELRYAVRERRKGTDWGTDLSTTGAQAASRFVADLIRELTGSE